MFQVSPSSPLGCHHLEAGNINTATTYDYFSLPHQSNLLDVSIPTLISLLIVGIGSLCIPHFIIGLLVGAMNFCVAFIINRALQAIFPLVNENGRSNYAKSINMQPFLVMLYAPILEEFIFRGILQPLLLAVATLLVPSTPIAIILGVSLSGAAIFSICVAAVLFGAVHLSNDHKGAFRQSLNCVVSGIVFGLLAFQFGLLTAIAAHMMNNILAYQLVRLCTSSRSDVAVENGIGGEFSNQPQLAEQAQDPDALQSPCPMGV